MGTSYIGASGNLAFCSHAPKLFFVTSKGLAHSQARSQESQGTNEEVFRSKYLYRNQYKYLPRLYSAVNIRVSFRYGLCSSPEDALSSLLTKHSTSSFSQILRLLHADRGGTGSMDTYRQSWTV